jgi:tetratricopeptide (TPR) repeat protein
LSQTYLAQGKTSEALALVESGIKSSPKSIELYSEMGKIYTASHNYDKAVAAYTKVVELGQASSPLVESAQRSLDTLKAGSISGSAASTP